MTDQTLRTLQAALVDRDRLQSQATSQRVFRTPSDDPAASATALGLHGEQARVAQYARNVSDGMAWVTTADTALGSAIDLLNRARDLTAQGANSGALSQAARDSIAAELESIGASLLAQANTTVLGRSVFAGTSDAGRAFEAGTYTFNGTAGSSVDRRINDNETVRVDVDGSQAFGAGAASIFAVLGDIATELRAGAEIGPRLADIDARLTSMIEARGATGAQQAQLERASSQNLSASIDLEARRADVEDVDSLEVLVRLQSAELVFQSALQVTARSLQTNLLEFLR
ncbi:flagellin [Microbacterium aoyamense]|uniref:Flagellin n=1 Tax=Microbacterium aoyamense TaxID=344166 RepID=A0ABP5AM47_9MICO|nr:flagellin [Microbacterium aoyamense]